MAKYIDMLYSKIWYVILEKYEKEKNLLVVINWVMNLFLAYGGKFR